MGKRTGIWISIEIMEDKKLDWVNKILLAEILSLHEMTKGCIASNYYFGELLEVTSGSASKRITKLTNLGYIKTENIKEKGKCIGRIITPIEKKNKPASVNSEAKEQDDSSMENQKVVPERPEGTSLTTMGVLPERPGGTSLMTTGVVPERPEGTSLTTMGVVPERPGSTSPGNTINTIIITDREKEIEKQQEIIKQALEQDAGPDSEIPKSSIQKDEDISPIKEMRKAMAEWFYDYPDWEQDLYKLGLDNFIWKTAEKYNTGSQEDRDIIKYFLSL